MERGVHFRHRQRTFIGWRRVSHRGDQRHADVHPALPRLTDQKADNDPDEIRWRPREEGCEVPDLIEPAGGRRHRGGRRHYVPEQHRPIVPYPRGSVLQQRVDASDIGLNRAKLLIATTLHFLGHLRIAPSRFTLPPVLERPFQMRAL
jgi:hypothetical protein